MFCVVSQGASAFSVIRTSSHGAKALYASTIETSTEEATFMTGSSVSGMTAGLKTIFTTEEIDAIIPHKYPFALVDKVVSYEKGKRAVGIKCVTKVRLLIAVSQILHDKLMEDSI